MVWLRRSGLSGTRSSAIDTVSRRSPDDRRPVIAAIFEDKTVSISDRNQYELCHFKRCNFLWEGVGLGLGTKIFLNCNFDDCDFGMPLDEFLTFTHAAIVNMKPRPRITRRQAIDEAVRRYYRQHPVRTQLCLEPSYPIEREELAEWVRAEYQRIIAEDVRPE